MSRHKTFRGREFNMSAFSEKYGDTRAVSNVPMNARGDILDEKGKVKVKSGTVARGLRNIADKNTSKQVSIKSDYEAEPVKQAPVQEDEIVTEPVTVTPPMEEAVSEDDTLVNESPEVDDEFDPGGDEIVSRKDLGDGTEEVEYADGSIEVVNKVI